MHYTIHEHLLKHIGAVSKYFQHKLSSVHLHSCLTGKQGILFSAGALRMCVCLSALKRKNRSDIIYDM